jgi:excinuclease ABC subunit A
MPTIVGKKNSTKNDRPSTNPGLRTSGLAAEGAHPAWLTVVGAKHNNLKNLTVAIPLGRFVGITGVSGSGKSSLVNDILREALARDLNGAENVHPGEHDRIDGLEHLDKVIDIDQSPIGRTPRSNPATYIKVFDEIRDLYTKLPDSKVRGYKPGRFSFNVSTGKAGGGRCEACEGNGSDRMEMEFLADVWVTCPVCNGKRFSRETLQILFKGKSITDVLDMDVQQALDHFANVPSIASMLQTLHDVGLDYLKLGQSSTTLSGGEAQRIKLARELVKKSTGRTLYLLDEPTTGLHFADIKKLLSVLHGFVDSGNTVVVIEHNLDVIKTADWIIDLGPEGGVDGGFIVAEGTPEGVTQNKQSFTGQVLREVLFNGRGDQNPERKRRVKRMPARNRDSGRQREVISVVGARQHNLKDITVEFPRGKTTVCCGPSGSGKSSFAIDTVYTEGQRRYVESLSSYARQFLGRLQPPKVDHVYGLSPAICIEQKNTSKSPRSTVGTVTEIYDYMRVLLARIGKPYCPKCKVPVGTQNADEIVEKILALGEGARLLLLAPVEPAGNETYEHLFRRERANGYARVRIDGALHVLDDSIAIDARQHHDVELVVDRVVVRRSQASRLADSVEQALAVGQGIVLARRVDLDDQTRECEGDSGPSAPAERPLGLKSSARIAELRFSQHRSCTSCGRSFEELTPHHFSFNTRIGWCESCEGLGVQHGANPAAIVVHPTRSIVDGAIAGWGVLQGTSKLHVLASALAEHLGFDVNTPWDHLTPMQQLAFLQGCADEWIELRGRSEPGARATYASGSYAGLRFQWRGFFPAIHRATLASPAYRERLAELVTDVPCEACAGSRLRPDAAAVRVGDETLHEICLRPLDKALAWFQKLRLDPRDRKIAGELLHEVTSRLRFLVDVGLDYLTLHRTTATLSGGEAQRIQLASQIGTGLTGVLYVLDEPTIGLHPRDNARLIGALRRLRDLGNTLLLVEHDREVIDSADHVLDFGPGAGDFGGRITAAADPQRLRTQRASLTGKYLSGKETIPVPSNRRPVAFPPRDDLVALPDDDPVELSRRPTPATGKSGVAPAWEHGHRWLTVHGARQHNLKEIDVAFPLSRFTCVTGVSGSGKSTLVSDILYNALAARIHRANLVPGGHERITGIEYIDKVINVDQTPIGNSPTSNPATYTGLFDAMRDLYAALPLSKIRGYTANRFSFNRAGGRCEVCQGMGQKCIEMHFLPDVWIECDNCRGSRFVPETLEVQFHNKSIADVLSMRISEAVTLFENVPRVRRMLQTLDDVGLGYLQLGQSAPTLSGGEAQRVKLAAELGRPSTGKTLYILDEPTTGLHFDDLKKLLAVLHRLVDLGNSVICVEHNLDVIKTADWVIDLGPDAGDAGGYIVAEGTPETVSSRSQSHTGTALRPVLARGPLVHRQAYDPRRQTGLVSSFHTTVDLGEQVKMPWELDGCKWHTVDHCDAKGEPAQWDAKVLVWIAATIESLGAFVPTDWNHRTRIEIKAANTPLWFAHVLTGFKDLLEVAVRVPTSTFYEPRLRAMLDIRTLDERSDLPIYGQWSRLRVRTLSTWWDDIRLSLRDFKDVHKSPFRAFLKTAVAAYFRGIGELQREPERQEPWKSMGEEWHLSQKAMSPCQTPQWKPALLLALIGRFKSVQPGLELDWSAKTAVLLKATDRPAYCGKIVTNMGRGLRVELRAPQNVVTPAQMDRLGEDAEIRPRGEDDWLIFWVRSLTDMDSGQLRSVWRQCNGVRPSGELQSA